MTLSWRILFLLLAILLMGAVTLAAAFRGTLPAWVQPAAWTAFFVAWVAPG